MAYELVIAAVKPEKFSDFMDQLRGKNENDPLPFLEPEELIIISHHYWEAGTGYAPMDDAMVNLLDSGQEISEAYWHPHRPPLYKDASLLKPLVDEFKTAYQDVRDQLMGVDLQYLDLDILPIIHLADSAVQNKMSLLTFLDKPLNHERASKVRYPIDIRIERDY